MPKLVDYSVRFELIREAVVRVAARDGSRAVDLNRIAAEMQMSASTLRRISAALPRAATSSLQMVVDARLELF